MKPTTSLLSHPPTNNIDGKKTTLFAIDSCLLYSVDDEDVGIFFEIKEEGNKFSGSTNLTEAPAQHSPLVVEKRGSDSKARRLMLENKGSTKSRMSRSVSYCIGNQDPKHSYADVDFHMGMHRSLTDDDFSELKGCIDLGFRFDEASVPQLSHILPALEVCSAITHNFHKPPVTISPPSWKVANPGDSPEDVKERLRHWAQAVACNLRLRH